MQRAPSAHPVRTAVRILAGPAAALLLAASGASHAATWPNETLAALRQEVDAELAGLTPVGTILAGSVTVVLPDATRLRQPGVVYPKLPPVGTDGKEVEAVRVGNQAIAQAIEKSRIFESVSIVETYDPASFVSTTNWTLVCDVTHPRSAEWELRHTATGWRNKVPASYYITAILLEGVPGLHLAQWPRAVNAIAPTKQSLASQDPVAATRIVQPATKPVVGEIRPLAETGGPRPCPVPTPSEPEPNAVDVAISEADTNRVDEFHHAIGGKAPYSIWTGPVWARIFVGDPDSAPMFNIMSTSLRAEISGVKTRFRYSIDGALSVNGKNYMVHSEGTSAALSYDERAMSEAVQSGIVSAAHKVKAVLEAAGSTAP